MKQKLLKTKIIKLRIFIASFLFAIISLFLFSFTVNKMADDFLKQLGISSPDADKKITSSILGGVLNSYGVRNVKNITIGNRAAIVKDLLAYTKQQAGSKAFINEYTTLKESERPQTRKIQTPEEMRANLVTTYKNNIVVAETNLKKADASLKAIYVQMLADSKKGLKEAEDPKNEMIASYKNSYPGLVKSFEESYKQELQQWETKYSSNHLFFVKKRLQQFLDETKDIDFSAALTEKNGKKYFVNKVYESKSRNWKMAFRAGKEVVESAREFVQQWIKEIK